MVYNDIILYIRCIGGVFYDQKTDLPGRDYD